MAERMNRTLIKMISSYIGLNHTNWDLFLQHISYGLLTAVQESTGKPPSELFLSRKGITPFQRLAIMLDSEYRFLCQYVDKLARKAQDQINKAQKQQALYSDTKQREVGYFVFLEKHWHR